MGCKHSQPVHSGHGSVDSIGDGTDDESGSLSVFGSGVHVGRCGNVNLAGRDLDVLGPRMVAMISADILNHTATSLTLSNNKLYALAKELPLLSKLREIEIDHNRFQRFPEVLVRLPRLWRIDASFNPLDSARGFDVLPRMLSLKCLVVRDCGLKEVPAAVLMCEVLEELDLGNNPDIKMTGVALHRLTRLKKLSIAYCGLGGRTLPSTIKHMKLTSLDISGNAFTFSDPHFFGPSLPRTLEELHLADMHLTGPPAVVALLKKLTYIDLAENPIQTLDVLAGRIVKRMPHASSSGLITASDANANALAEVAEEELDDTEEELDDTASHVSGGATSAATSRISLSKLSRAGIVAHITQPIPLKRLSLRACNFRTVPKYFHKLDHLEELDLSENDNLDDPNMTLFSLQNLVTLNIVGCPFAEDPAQSRNEWFDISKLHSLRNIQWEVWRSAHNMSPYRTKIPIELCILPLQTLNEVPLRHNLFTGSITDTVINLLSDGYFKVDLSVDEMILPGHMAAVGAFTEAERFFHPTTITDAGVAGTEGITPTALAQVHLRIALSRYVFFLAMQAANYDAVIVPPLDVMVIHYAQLTVRPSQYRTDCEAVCGRVLDCNYRAVFTEQTKRQAETRSVVEASRRIWNLMVRSAQRDLAWLRYDFWDKRLRASSETNGALAAAAAAPAPPTAALSAENAARPALSSSFAALPDDATVIPKTLPLLVGKTAEEVIADWKSLSSIESARDLASVLDQAITSHFEEKGVHEFAASLHEFFDINRCFLRHATSLEKTDLDWGRYVKYLTLYAYRYAVLEDTSTLVVEPIADADGNLVAPTRTSSLLGKRYDAIEQRELSSSKDYLPKPIQNGSGTAGGSGAAEESGGPPSGRTLSGLVRRSPSSLLRTRKSNKRMAMARQLGGNPVPTIGLVFMLHAHRTSHLKYYQSLSLFALEAVDVVWGTEGKEGEVDRLVKQTKAAWMALYEEAYIVDNDAVPFRYRVENGILMPTADAKAGVAASEPVETAPSAMAAPLMEGGRYEYTPTTSRRPSCLRARRRKNANADRCITFSSADTEFGVY